MTERRSSRKEGETGRLGEGVSATPMLLSLSQRSLSEVEGQTEEIDL